MSTEIIGDGTSVMQGTDATQTRMGERLAVLEVKVSTIKEDTTITRTWMHSVNSEMQKLVGADAVFQLSLAGLTTQVTKLAEAVVPIATAVEQFKAMHDDLTKVIWAKNANEGIKARSSQMFTRITAAAAAVAVIGGVAGGIIWVATHMAMTVQ